MYSFVKDEYIYHILSQTLYLKCIYIPTNCYKYPKNYTYPVKTFSLKNMTINPVQFSPSSGATSINTSYKQEKKKKWKIKTDYKRKLNSKKKKK